MRCPPVALRSRLGLRPPLGARRSLRDCGPQPVRVYDDVVHRHPTAASVGGDCVRRCSFIFTRRRLRTVPTAEHGDGPTRSAFVAAFHVCGDGVVSAKRSPPRRRRCRERRARARSAVAASRAVVAMATPSRDHLGPRCDGAVEEFRYSRGRQSSARRTSYRQHVRAGATPLRTCFIAFLRLEAQRRGATYLRLEKTPRSRRRLFCCCCNGDSRRRQPSSR